MAGSCTNTAAVPGVENDETRPSSLGDVLRLPHTRLCVAYKAIYPLDTWPHDLPSLLAEYTAYPHVYFMSSAVPPGRLRWLGADAAPVEDAAFFYELGLPAGANGPSCELSRLHYRGSLNESYHRNPWVVWSAASSSLLYLGKDLSGHWGTAQSDPGHVLRCELDPNARSGTRTPTVVVKYADVAQDAEKRLPAVGRYSAQAVWRPQAAAAVAGWGQVVSMDGGAHFVLLLCEAVGMTTWRVYNVPRECWLTLPTDTLTRYLCDREYWSGVGVKPNKLKLLSTDNGLYLKGTGTGLCLRCDIGTVSADGSCASGATAASVRTSIGKLCESRTPRARLPGGTLCVATSWFDTNCTWKEPYGTAMYLLTRKDAALATSGILLHRGTLDPHMALHSLVTYSSVLPVNCDVVVASKEEFIAATATSTRTKQEEEGDVATISTHAPGHSSRLWTPYQSPVTATEETAANAIVADTPRADPVVDPVPQRSGRCSLARRIIVSFGVVWNEYISCKLYRRRRRSRVKSAVRQRMTGAI